MLFKSFMKKFCLICWYRIFRLVANLAARTQDFSWPLLSDSFQFARNHFWVIGTNFQSYNSLESSSHIWVVMRMKLSLSQKTNFEWANDFGYVLVTYQKTEYSSKLALLICWARKIELLWLNFVGVLLNFLVSANVIYKGVGAITFLGTQICLFLKSSECLPKLLAVTSLGKNEGVYQKKCRNLFLSQLKNCEWWHFGVSQSFCNWKKTLHKTDVTIFGHYSGLSAQENL